MKTSIYCVFALLVAHSAVAAENPGGTVTAEQQRLGLLLAPKVGFFKSTSSLNGAAYVGVEVGYITPLLEHKLAIMLEGTWYRPALNGATPSPQLTINGSTADPSYRLSERQFAALLSLVYRADDLVPRLVPYGGLGPGLYIHKSTATAFGTTNTETEGSLGFQLLAGAEYALGPGGAFLEIHYHFTRVDFLTTGNANVGGFLAASLGYRFVF